MRTSFHHQSEAQPPNGPLTAVTSPDTPSSSPITQSFEPEDFPETAEMPAIGGLLRLRFGLRGDRFWPEGDFRRFVSGRRNLVSPMQIDLSVSANRMR